MFPEKVGGTLRFEGNKINWFPDGPVIKKNKDKQNFEKRVESYDNITPPSLTFCSRARAVKIRR